MRDRIITYTTLPLNKKTSLVFVLAFTVVIVLDSTIVDFSTYSGVRIPHWVNISIFVIFSIFYVVSSTILLNSTSGIKTAYTYKSALPLDMKYFRLMIVATQILTSAIIVMIILQMIFLNKYSLALLNAQTFLSHLSALLFLSLLVFLFIRWLSSPKKSYVIILYAISFALVSCNIVVSLVYLESYFTGTSSASPDIKPYPISRYVTDLSGSAFSALLSVIFDIISASSFLLMWIATAILLSQYRNRIGRIKYFALICIPLIYYVFPFQGYFGDIFFPLLISLPISISIVYVLFFSATKQLGALLFSLSFWTASTLTHDVQVRKSMLMSAIGMTILFCTLDNSPLQYHAYPPYGLITEAFLPLGTFLIFTGIFTSARHFAGDAKLRKEFQMSAASQLDLLRYTGISEMEKEYEHKVKYLGKTLGLSDEPQKPQFETEMDEADVRETLHEVLNELYYSKRKDEWPSS